MKIIPISSVLLVAVLATGCHRGRTAVLGQPSAVIPSTGEVAAAIPAMPVFAAPVEATAVPEPSAVLGLSAVAVLMVSARRRQVA